MKKILIVSHAMEIGGAERALLGILENIDTKEYHVDLFLLRHEGELLDLIPDHINLLPEIGAYTVFGRPMISTLKEGHILLTAMRLYGKVKAVLYDRKHEYRESAVAIEYSHKYCRKLLPQIQKNVEYDLAISFLTPHYFVAEKVRAKRKIAWIHTDYAVVQIDSKSELKMWKIYDYIASISEAVTDSFLYVFPSLKKKIVKIENILPKTLIEKQAQVEISEEFGSQGINLLSIGRFSSAKNFDNVPDICKRIRENGIDVRWYLIGYGSDEGLIRQKILESGMQDYVILLGKKDNPYPYIKKCDVYIQPSRYEGKCVAVREAQMLGKPVIITNYTTAKSQLEDGVDGIIVPMENEICAKKIAQFLCNKKMQDEVIRGTQRRSYSNDNEMQKIYKLIDNEVAE